MEKKIRIRILAGETVQRKRPDGWNEDYTFKKPIEVNATFNKYGYYEFRLDGYLYKVHHSRVYVIVQEGSD